LDNQRKLLATLKKIRGSGLRKRAAHILGVGWAALALASCASVPPPVEEMASASTSISLAEQAGAAEDAPLEIASARQKLKTARAAMAEEDYVTATRLTEKAQIEAELAQAKAQSATAQRALQQVRESIRLLREEIGTGTGAS